MEQALEIRNQRGQAVSIGVSRIDCADKSTLASQPEESLWLRGTPVTVIRGDSRTRPTSDRFACPDEALGFFLDSYDYASLDESP